MLPFTIVPAIASTGAAGSGVPERYPLLTIATFLVVVCVLLHYEALRLLARILPRITAVPRLRAITMILGILSAHVIEILIFACGYLITDNAWKFGLLVGDLEQVDDYVYFSAVVYTTLGFGDLVPEGPLRLLAGAEALTGLVLVGWSSAFTFLHMQRYWHTTEEPRGAKGAEKNSSGSKSPS
jgi:hypothetical protein